MRSRVQSVLQAGLIALLIHVLVFPPGLTAAAPNQQTLNWQGGTGNWTDLNWCGTDCPSATFPNNGNIDPADTYLAYVNTGNDNVTLSSSTNTTGNINIDGLLVGNGNNGEPSQVNVGSAILTLGSTTPTPDGSVLTMNGGGTLNIQTGGNVTLELNSGGVVNNYATASTQGINVTDGGTLVLQNTAGGLSTINNYGNINVAGSSSAATLQLNDSGANSGFLLTQSGTLSLSGIAQVKGQNGDETLINDTGHTISGAGTISNLLGFSNHGTLSESGGLTISGITGTYSTLAQNNGINNTGAIFANNNLTFDTTSGGSFYNQSLGTITANDGSTLTFRNISPTGMGVTPNTAVFQNDGIINVGSNPSISGATLVLDSTDGTKAAAGTATVFDLQSPGGTGTLNLYGNSTIQGQTGTEGLINDSNHTIVATNGGAGTIQNLASIANNGTIQIGDINGSASLTVDTTTGGTTGTFSNNSKGQMNVLDGGTLNLQNINGGTAIFNNDGAITLGQSVGANLQLIDAGIGTAFDLTSNNGTGSLTLNAGSGINGYFGTESLTNDSGHAIYISNGGTGNISNLSQFTNNGFVQATGSLNISGVGGFNQGYSGEIDATGNLSIQSQSFYNDGYIFSYGGNITLDTTAAKNSFNNDIDGFITQADGTTLTLRNVSGVTPGVAVVQNEGVINIGSSAGASLVLDSTNGTAGASGTGTTFDLASLGGYGQLNLVGTSTIQGATGTENLINGEGHLILVGANLDTSYTQNIIGGSTTVSNLAGFTNNGSIIVGQVPACSCTGQQASAATRIATPTATLTIDTTSRGGFSNAMNSDLTPGFIGVYDGSTLVFQNTSGNPAVFNNDGQISVGYSSGATLRLNDGGNGTTFDLTSNNGTGVLDLVGNSKISGVNGTESLINDMGHTINGDASSNSVISNLASFTNNGNINVLGSGVTGGALTFDTSNGGSFYNSGTGSISVNPDGALTFRHQSADPTNPVTAVFQNDGQIVLGTTGMDNATLFLDSSDTNGNGTSTTFKLTSSGSGSLTFYGGGEGGISGVTGTESLINDTNHTIAAGNGSTVLVGNLASIVNNGTIQVGDNTGTGSLSIDTSNFSGSASVFSNSAKANVNVLAGSTLVFQNTAKASAAFNNDGTITLNSGTLQLFAGGGATSFSLTSSGTGQLIMNGTSSINSAYGVESLTNGAGQTITNNGTSTISRLASFTNNGTVNVAAGSLEITTTNPTFQNTGTVTVGAAPVVTFENVTSAALTTSPGVVMTVDGSMMNSGNVTVYAGAGLNINGVSDGQGGTTGDYTQTGGTTDIEAGGILSINTDGATFYLQGGDLTGGGELNASLDQTGGTLNPGDPQSFTIDGNYTLDQGGGLDFDLAGLGTGQYDQVMIGGSVSIDANAQLMVKIDPGFTAQAGQLFTDVLSWKSGGLPNLLSYNDLGLGLIFSLVQDTNNSNELDLLVSSASSAAPEPGTLSLLFGAMLIGGAIAWRVRRRRLNAVN